MARVDGATPLYVAKICTHAKATTLSPKLPSPLLCPTCTITSQIAAVQTIQGKFDACGGVLKSQQKGEDRHTTPAHKAMRRAWRTAKIALANTIQKFQDLLEDKSTPVQDLAKLREALDVWDKKKIVLTRVPGLRYVEGAGEGEPTDDDKKEAQLLMMWLKMVVEKEMTPEELASPRTNQPVVTSLPVSSHIPTTSRSQYAVPQQRPNIRPSECPLLALAQSLTTSSPSPQQNAAMLKPALKRPRDNNMADSPSASPSPPRKRVRLSNTVTVSPEHLYVTNPSPFRPLSRTAIVLPHATHTFAKHHRRRPEFHRKTQVYVPGVWSSGTTSEIVDTSFRGKTRVEMEKIYKQESEEQEQEQELAAKLKEASRGWVALWWAKNMAPNLNLEKLKMEMTT
ncbi:hypothetical protein ACET3X_007154 [Alternaria dauci]|uniref:Uncharacterized protein n=1 Tax=Alternaria dauci TaxID=48095 RepID=A0ABR3UFS1_9PLEO